MQSANRAENTFFGNALCKLQMKTAEIGGDESRLSLLHFNHYQKAQVD